MGLIHIPQSSPATSNSWHDMQIHLQLYWYVARGGGTQPP